jgi:hypothetical protein
MYGLPCADLHDTQHYVQISYIEFHTNRTISVGNRGRNPLPTLGEVWLSLRLLPRNSNLPDKFVWILVIGTTARVEKNRMELN